MAEAKIRPKAMFMRAIYKEYVEKHETVEGAGADFLADYPGVTYEDNYTVAEYTYIFRPVTEGE